MTGSFFAVEMGRDVNIACDTSKPQSSRKPGQESPQVLAAVEYAYDDARVLLDDEVDTVGIAREHGSSEVLISLGKSAWILTDSGQYQIDGV